MKIHPLQVRASVADVPPEQLARHACLSEPQKIAEACRHFEALLLRQILQDTQKAVIPSRFTDTSTAACIYRDMVTERLADSIAKSGALGLARTLEQQLQRPCGHGGPHPAAQGPATSCRVADHPAPSNGPARPVSSAHE